MSMLPADAHRRLVRLSAAPQAKPVQPVALLLFVAMDDEKLAHLTWCVDEAAVREAVKASMFFLQVGEELSPEHLDQLDGSVEELLQSGALIFEGDPPLYLYRVPSAPAVPTHAVQLTDKQVAQILSAHEAPPIDDGKASTIGQWALCGMCIDSKATQERIDDHQ